MVLYWIVVGNPGSMPASCVKGVWLKEGCSQRLVRENFDNQHGMGRSKIREAGYWSCRCTDSLSICTPRVSIEDFHCRMKWACKADSLIINSLTNLVDFGSEFCLKLVSWLVLRSMRVAVLLSFAVLGAWSAAPRKWEWRSMCLDVLSATFRLWGRPMLMLCKMLPCISKKAGVARLNGSSHCLLVVKAPCTDPKRYIYSSKESMRPHNTIFVVIHTLKAKKAAERFCIRGCSPFPRAWKFCCSLELVGRKQGCYQLPAALWCEVSDRVETHAIGWFAARCCGSRRECSGQCEDARTIVCKPCSPVPIPHLSWSENFLAGGCVGMFMRLRSQALEVANAHK